MEFILLLGAGAALAWAVTRPRVPQPPPPQPPPAPAAPPQPGRSDLAPPSPGQQLVQPGRQGGFNPLDLARQGAEALAGLVASQESTKLVLPYIAAGITAIALLVSSAILGASALAGPWGFLVGAIIVVAVVLVTAVVDVIVVAVKQGDWNTLCAKLKELRDVKCDARTAQEVFRRSVVEMQLGVDVRAPTQWRFESGNSARPDLAKAITQQYTGYPFMPSPLTWHELKKAPSQFPPEVRLGQSGTAKNEPLVMTGAEGFITAIRKDIASVREVGLDPSKVFGQPVQGVPGYVLQNGALKSVTTGPRDVRWSKYPRAWFDGVGPLAREKDEPELWLRMWVASRMCEQLGGTGPDGVHVVGGYVGAVFAGLAPWLSDRAVRYFVTGEDQLPERPACLDFANDLTNGVATATNPNPAPAGMPIPGQGRWKLIQQQPVEWLPWSSDFEPDLVPLKNLLRGAARMSQELDWKDRAKAGPFAHVYESPHRVKELVGLRTPAEQAVDEYVWAGGVVPGYGKRNEPERGDHSVWVRTEEVDGKTVVHTGGGASGVSSSFAQQHPGLGSPDGTGVVYPPPEVQTQAPPPPQMPPGYEPGPQPPKRPEDYQGGNEHPADGFFEQWHMQPQPGVQGAVSLPQFVQLLTAWRQTFTANQANPAMTATIHQTPVGTPPRGGKITWSIGFTMHMEQTGNPT